MSSTRKRKSLAFWLGAAALGAFLVAVNVLAVKRLYVPPSPLDNFQQLNTFSPVQDNILLAAGEGDPATVNLPRPDERAVVTTLYSESYVNGVLTLAHSLKAVRTSARLVLLYFPDRVSSRTQCRSQAAGWELHPIRRIPPPDGGRGVYYRFLDQYSKLQIWGLDTLGIKTVVYLDGDTLVRQNFDELWSLPFAFAAVPDVYGDNRGFTLGFNAGVMFLRTSSAVLADMLGKIGTAKYRRSDAEQGFLNVYFAAQAVRLPYIYNANLALKRRSPDIWHAIEKDMRIVHYTLVKPFYEDDEYSYREAGEFVLMQSDLLRDRKLLDDGVWKEEMGWWETSWREMTENYDGRC